MRKLKKYLSLALALTMIFSCTSVLFGCNDDGPVIDNENTRLVLSTSELDGVFNPFYSSSGPDGSIVGMTQIGMLSADKDGKVAYGENEACVVLDYESIQVMEDDGVTVKETVYRFVLKNNLKFSNGSPLTMKDVLFNLYVYLDPAYYGSSTIYSTEIIGLEEYRTQSTNKKEQESFNAQFSSLATLRIDRLVECLEEIYDANKSSLTDEQMIAALTEMKNEYVEYDELYGTIVDDYKLAKEYFIKELRTDYNYAKGTAQDISFLDKNGQKVALSTDTEAFLYNEGYITWDDEDLCFVYKLGADSKNWTEEYAINAIYNTFVPNDMIMVVKYWNTANELHTYFSLLEKQKYFENLDPNEKIENISGIKYANIDTAVTVNGVVYDVPTLDESTGAVTSGNEVLEITIDKVDPKAIWNFAFTVAPMYYYSNAEQIALFDYARNAAIAMRDDIKQFVTIV